MLSLFEHDGEGTVESDDVKRVHHALVKLVMREFAPTDSTAVGKPSM